MEMAHELQVPDPAAVPNASNDLDKLIRKLRWIGMEEEAEGLVRELARRHATAAGGVLATARRNGLISASARSSGGNAQQTAHHLSHG